MKDAVAGTQAALCEFVKGDTKSSDSYEQKSYNNVYAVYKYYQYMLRKGTSQKPSVPDKPDTSISFSNDTSKDIVTKEIKDATYHVLPYILKSTSDPNLSLTNAPKGSYIDDVSKSGFNVYVPISSLPDAAFASITVAGSVSASVSYTDICTYSPQAKCEALLLGEHEYTLSNSADHTHSHGWTLPALFSYELTVVGKESGDLYRD